MRGMRDQLPLVHQDGFGDKMIGKAILVARPEGALMGLVATG